MIYWVPQPSVTLTTRQYLSLLYWVHNIWVKRPRSRNGLLAILPTVSRSRLPQFVYVHLKPSSSCIKLVPSKNCTLAWSLMLFTALFDSLPPRKCSKHGCKQIFYSVVLPENPHIKCPPPHNHTCGLTSLIKQDLHFWTLAVDI